MKFVLTIAVLVLILAFFQVNAQETKESGDSVVREKRQFGFGRRFGHGGFGPGGFGGFGPGGFGPGGFGHGGFGHGGFGHGGFGGFPGGFYG